MEDKMDNSRVKTFMIAVFLVVPAILFSDALPGPVVTAKWLKRHVDDEDIRIVDVSFEKKGYTAGHIPNAVFVDWRTELADPGEKHYFILPRPDFEKLMSRIGVTPGTRLVFYDDFNNRLAIRALWVAEYYGHSNAAILKGGVQAWEEGGYRLTENSPKFRSTRYTVRSVNSGLNVDKEFVRRNLSNPDVLFVDGRPAGMYTGLINGKAIHTGEMIARRGHLPGAVNQPWKALLDNHSEFLDEHTLEAMFRDRGIDRDRETVVFYCNEGVHAAFDWFVAAKILRYENAKIYDGSMSEWAEDERLPLVLGAQD
jgi:thiosulfate/3-mercaptopyruvate sulfurtransferase